MTLVTFPGTFEAGCARELRPDKAEALLRPGRSPERASAEAKGSAAWIVGFHPRPGGRVYRVRPRQGRPRPDFVDGQNPACCSVSARERPGVEAAPLHESVMTAVVIRG